MRVIIAGGGHIGYQLAQQLASQRDVVVIEEDPELISRLDRLDVQIIRGSATHPKTLHDAQLTEADKFIACSESDERNIIACLAAKRAGGPETFCFVSKEEYYHAFKGSELGGGESGDGDRGAERASRPTPHEVRDSGLGIDRLIWPQYMLAEEIARIVLVPQAIDVEVFAGGRIWLLEYRLHKDSQLLGKPLAALGLPRGVLAVAVMRRDRLYVPSGQTELRAEDKVVFMGTQHALRKLERRFFRQARRHVRDVTIIGGGTVGLTLAKRLEQEEDLRLKIIERSAERCETLAAELKSTLVLHGDGTDLELLEAEQIFRSDVLVSVTSDDEKNLLSSLLARQMKIPKVITRVNKPANIRLFEEMGIDVPLNPRVTAIRTVITLLQEPNIQLLATIEQGKGDVLELVLPEDFPATRIKHLPRSHDAIIAAVQSGNRTIVPHGEDTIQPGDRLFIFCTQEASQAVRKFFLRSET